MTDRYNRRLNYLRISVTDRCNLQCIYCLPCDHLPRKEILSYEEILYLVRVSVSLGISKVRVTGGEPLVRRGVYDFLQELTKINGLSDVSLTTNGVLLGDNIERIKSAGIKRINISIDTLNRQKFKEITGKDYFYQVWEGVELAQKTGFNPIKLNVVAMKGINDDELTDLARLSFFHSFHIRFIEYMPIGTPRLNPGRRLPASEIMERLSLLGRLIPVENGINDGPAERYKLEGAKGEIGLIRPVSRHFCNRCNRLRLTTSGRLRTCLLSDHQEDLKGPLRSGCSDSRLIDIFLKAAHHKPPGHNLAHNQTAIISCQMSAIGG